MVDGVPHSDPSPKSVYSLFTSLRISYHARHAFAFWCNSCVCLCHRPFDRYHTRLDLLIRDVKGAYLSIQLNSILRVAHILRSSQSLFSLGLLHISFDFSLQFLPINALLFCSISRGHSSSFQNLTFLSAKPWNT